MSSGCRRRLQIHFLDLLVFFRRGGDRPSDEEDELDESELEEEEDEEDDELLLESESESLEEEPLAKILGGGGGADRPVVGFGSWLAGVGSFISLGRDQGWRWIRWGDYCVTRNGSHSFKAGLDTHLSTGGSTVGSCSRCSCFLRFCLSNSP